MTLIQIVHVNALTTFREADSRLGASILWRAWEANSLTWRQRITAFCAIRTLASTPVASHCVAVLGEDPEKGWTALLHGGKLVDAVCRKVADEDCRLCIVVESDFIGCLMARLQQSHQAETSPQI